MHPDENRMIYFQQNKNCFSFQISPLKMGKKGSRNKFLRQISSSNVQFYFPTSVFRIQHHSECIQFFQTGEYCYYHLVELKNIEFHETIFMHSIRTMSKLTQI